MNQTKGAVTLIITLCMLVGAWLLGRSQAQASTPATPEPGDAITLTLSDDVSIELVWIPPRCVSDGRAGGRTG